MEQNNFIKDACISFLTECLQWARDEKHIETKNKCEDIATAFYEIKYQSQDNAMIESYRAGEYDGLMIGINKERIYTDEFDYLTKQKKQNGKKV